jgi:4-alpha-glucanotransferase
MEAHNRQPRRFEELLAELAALWGVQTGYRDSRSRRRESPQEVVLQVLEALGAGYGEELVARPAGEPGGARAERRLGHALALRQAELAERLVEPVVVAWEGVLPPFAGLGRSPETARTGGARPLRLTLLFEEGGEECWEAGRHGPRAECGESDDGGARRGPLPFGYHRLRVETGAAEAEATVISAPRRCWAPPPPREGAAGRAWGAFAPLYALRSERDWGAGDLADLERLCDLVGAAGGAAVATLPLLATYLDRPFEPCPYSPVSRMFWNEFYLAVDRIPEWAECPAARLLGGRGGAGDEVTPLRAEPLVQYREVMALKRRALEELCRHFFAHAGPRRREALSAYMQSRPEVVEYAAFRARVESSGGDWRSWPAGDTGAVTGSRPLSALSEAERYHLFCQWQMDQQLAQLAGHPVARAGEDANSAADGRPGLVLDLPVGVHPGGFDTWKWRDLFVGSMSTGAPPDAFFARGQDWASPPLHPQRIREQGHRYYVRCLQEHMRHARYLRVDHVMSLHRLFWVPAGREPTDGAYVGYPAEESYAALCLESWRHRTVVVGEDLGTVPAGVRAAMRRHQVLGTWVFQSALRPRAAFPVCPVPSHAVAALGTHDMFPFAGFVRGDDIGARLESGQLGQAGARREAEARQRLMVRLARSLPGREALRGSSMLAAPEPTAPGALLRNALAYLWDSPAELVLVNIEDLLLETRPQNLPGTDSSQGNWVHKMATTVAGLEPVVSSLPSRLLKNEAPAAGAHWAAR